MIVVRLVENSFGRYILHHDGTMLKADKTNIKELLLFFKLHEYFGENELRWDKDYTDISYFPGETIAEVITHPFTEYDCLENIKYENKQQNNTFLRINSPTIFNDLIKSSLTTEYISTAEYAALHDRSEASIKKYCQAGRIVGAENIKGRWRIPVKAPYPLDLRTVRHKRKKK